MLWKLDVNYFFTEKVPTVLRSSPFKKYNRFAGTQYYLSTKREVNCKNGVAIKCLDLWVWSPASTSRNETNSSLVNSILWLK